MHFFFHTVMCRGTNPDWLLINHLIDSSQPKPLTVECVRHRGKRWTVHQNLGQGAHTSVPCSVLPVLVEMLGALEQLVQL